MLRAVAAIIVVGCASDPPPPDGTTVETIFAATDNAVCLDGDLVVPLRCNTYDATNLGTGSQVEVLLPNCAYADGEVPCWTATLSPEACATTPSQYDVTVMRSAPPQNGTYTIVSCAAR